MARLIRTTLALLAAFMGAGTVAQGEDPDGRTAAMQQVQSDAAALDAVREAQREALMALPGVVGVGVQLSSGDQSRVVITVYVKDKASPALRNEIAARLGSAPVEIVEGRSVRFF